MARGKTSVAGARSGLSSVPAVMTIAGSDSGAGAGIQADLKTFTALGVFGTTAITCITAQNPDCVTGVEPISPAMVSRQIRTLCMGFPIAAAKTGMLFSASLIRMVAATVEKAGIPLLVVDPVMVATSGARLLQESAVAVLCKELIPRAAVITPNLHEAEILWGRAIHSGDELRVAAMDISAKFNVACVAKGGHIGGTEVTDVLAAEGRVTLFSGPRVKALQTHGTGCTFSAALTALLARGLSLPEAVRGAKAFVVAALEAAWRVGRHRPLGFAAAGTAWERVPVTMESASLRRKG